MTHTEAELARRLADELVAAGEITDPAWREAFERVPRHVFVPHAAVLDSADEVPHEFRPRPRVSWPGCWKRRAPYDRIIATASWPYVPPA